MEMALFTCVCHFSLITAVKCHFFFSPPRKAETPAAYRTILLLQYLGHLNGHVHIFSIIINAVPNAAFDRWILQKLAGFRNPTFSTNAKALSVIFILGLSSQIVIAVWARQTGKWLSNVFKGDFFVCANDLYSDWKGESSLCEKQSLYFLIWEFLESGEFYNIGFFINT